MSIHNYPYLKDSQFLKNFNLLKLKEQFIKIDILNLNEKFIESIHGKVTNGGNLNFNGNSAIRRTGNISLVAEAVDNDLDKVEHLLSINKKIEIQIGFTNTTDQYQDFPILWFPQGIYVISAPTINRTTTSATISLQVNDKMALLNGELGGTFPASVEFHQMNTFDAEGNEIVVKPTIHQIIQELVHHWGGEQIGKIIISDIDNKIKQVMKWTGETPLYQGFSLESGEKIFTTDLQEIDVDRAYETYEYGQDVGYRYTEFTYPGELIADAGNSICDILDKIKNTLGNYEYYYDVNGNFIFQEIKNYLNTSFATEVLKNQSNIQNSYIANPYMRSKSVYDFTGSEIVTAYTNNPQYNMIKNDFLVWGARKTATDATLPIRYHLSIDNKPKIGNTYKGFFYVDPNDETVKPKIPIRVDALPSKGIETVFYYLTTDQKIYYWNGKDKKWVATMYPLVDITTKDWRSELYLSGANAEGRAVDGNYYYAELANEWPKMYDLEAGDFLEEYKKDGTLLEYYLDFIDSDAAISELNISNIGRRTKVLNDDTINCIFEPEIPDIIFIDTTKSEEEIEQQENECKAKGLTYYKLSKENFTLLVAGGRYNSAYVAVRSLLYQYTKYNESISLQILPIYHLEPNTRITVFDPQSNIKGDYIINTISLPLTLNGIMMISAVKVLERI